MHCTALHYIIIIALHRAGPAPPSPPSSPPAPCPTFPPSDSTLSPMCASSLAVLAHARPVLPFLQPVADNSTLVCLCLCFPAFPSLKPVRASIIGPAVAAHSPALAHISSRLGLSRACVRACVLPCPALPARLDLLSIIAAPDPSTSLPSPASTIPVLPGFPCPTILLCSALPVHAYAIARRPVPAWLVS